MLVNTRQHFRKAGAHSSSGRPEEITMSEAASCSDFSKYCPVGSLCDESIGTHCMRSSKVKNTIAWFSKKQKTSCVLRHQVTVRPLGEDDKSDYWSPRDVGGASRRYVSHEELQALEGCVSKRRALFSLNQKRHNSLDASQTIPKRKPGLKFVPTSPERSHTLSSYPSRSHYPLSSNDDPFSRHFHQRSTEYDHLEEFSLSQASIPDSVSIQFRSNSQDCVSTQNSDGSLYSERVELLDCTSNESYLLSGSKGHPNLGQPICVKSNSIPGRLDSQSLTHCSDNAQGAKQLHVVYHTMCSHECMPSPLLRNCSQESSCNSWPRHRVQHVAPYEQAQSQKLYRKQYEKSSPCRIHKEPTKGATHSDTVSSNLRVPQVGSFGSNLSIASVQSHQSSLASSSCERTHSSFIKGVDGVEFKQRTNKMISWFSEFNDQQRNMLLLKLLEQSDCAQMHFLSMQMEPILHMGCPHNCQDLLSWLPSYITELILEYLDPVSLCRASQVNRWWYQLATQPKLWMNLCKLNCWQLSTFGEANLMESHTLLDGSVKWKSVFAEKFRLKRNWLKGYCTVRTFEGHTQGISCIQFDDTRIVSGSWDKTIKVWNRRTNTAWAALTLAGHSGTVRCLHLHGNRLVSGSSDRTIKVWDLSTDKVGWVGAACRATMVGHQHTVRCLQADDSKVISGSYDLTLKVWDIKTGQCIKTLRGHTDAVLCLQFADDNVVSGSKDMTIKVWSLSTGMCKLTLHGHQAAVTCVQFDETKIISGALDTLIKIWNFSNGECIRTIDWIRSEGHTGVIRHLQADSWKIISAADDKTMKVWSVHTGTRLLTLKSHTDGVTCLQFNDKVIVSGSYDKTVKLWDFSAC